ncbi:hypothetical protein BHE74_00018799, partial [Ensete ventricosum]
GNEGWRKVGGGSTNGPKRSFIGLGFGQWYHRLWVVCSSGATASPSVLPQRYYLEVLFLNICGPLHMIAPLENQDLSLLDIYLVGETFLFTFFPLEVLETTIPLDYSVLLNNLYLVLLPQMRLLDCDSSPIQPPLHHSRPSNVLNLLHTSVSYRRILSMPKRNFNALWCRVLVALGWLRILHRPHTSPCMSIEFFELAISLTSVSFAQLFRSLHNTSHFARSYLLPSVPLALSIVKFGCQHRAVARTQSSQLL